MNDGIRKATAIATISLMMVHETEAVNMPLAMRAIPMAPPAGRRVMPVQPSLIEPARSSPPAEPLAVEPKPAFHVSGAWIADLDAGRRRAFDVAAGGIDLMVNLFVAATRISANRIVDFWESRRDAPVGDFERVRWPKPETGGGKQRSETSLPARSPAPQNHLVPPIVRPEFEAPVETREEQREPMIERAPVRPKLLPVSSLTGLITEGEGKGGFRTIQMNRGKSVWITKFSRPMPEEGMGVRGVGRAAVAQPVGNGTNAPFFRQAAADATTERRMKDVNTDFNRVLGMQYQLVRTKGGVEEYRAADGTRIEHTYDQSKPVNERNREVYYRPDGTTQESVHCPLVFDLKGTGVRASDQWVRFDLSGKGLIETFHDIGASTGVLVFDADRNGVAGENGRELFGDGTDLHGRGKPGGFQDGFEALEALVRKAELDGVLPAGSLQSGRLGRAELALLTRFYGLGMRVGSLSAKTVSLDRAGIIEILLSRQLSERIRDFDGQGDDVVRRRGALFVRADGSRGSYEDIFFAYKAPSLSKASLGK